MLISIAAVNASDKSVKVLRWAVFVLTCIVFTCRFGSLMYTYPLGPLLQQQPVPILPQAEYRRVIESSPSARLARTPALPHSALPFPSPVCPAIPPLVMHLPEPRRHTLLCPAFPCSIPLCLAPSSLILISIFPHPVLSNLQFWFTHNTGRHWLGNTVADE